VKISGAVIYAWDVKSLATFYRELTGATVAETHRRWVILDVEGSRLVIHGSDRDEPDEKLGERRESTPIKLTFTVADLSAAHAAVMELGGGATDLSHAWDDAGVRFLNAWDLEGNVFTLRESA
jgi:predicted enzyme related to lactoylglutathione lyase